MINNIICFIRQYDSRIDLYVNVFKYGYDLLIWYPEDRETESNFIKLDKARITITAPKENGILKFYLINQEEKKATKEISLYMDYLNTDEEISAALKYSPNLLTGESWQQKLINRIKLLYETDKSKTLIECINKIKKETTDILKKQEDFLFKFSIAVEYYLNTKNIVMNKYNEENTKLIYGAELKYISSLTPIKLLKYENVNNRYKIVDKYISDGIFDTEITPSFGSERYYALIAKHNDETINWFYHYQFNDYYQAILWNNSQEKNDLDIDYISNHILTEISSIDLDEEDIRRLSLELTHKPYNYYLSKPIIEGENDYGAVMVTIPDYDLIKATGRKYYISSKEEDLLNESFSGRREEITDYKIKLDIRKHFLGGDTLFYIENENGIQISPLSRHEFGNVIDDYIEKVRIYEFDAYEKRLIESIREYAPFSENFIKDEVSRLKNDSDSNPNMAYLEIMNATYSFYKDKNQIDFIYFAIMDDWTKHFTLDSDFFKAPIRYYYNEDKITVPDIFTANRNFIVVLHYIELEDLSFQTEYALCSGTALEISTQSIELLILYAIDIKTGVRSGFLLFDNEDSINPFILKNNLIYERM